MLARHLGECGVTVNVGYGQQCATATIVASQAVRNPFQHPGPAEIQAVDVSELRVGAIGDDTRR